MDVNLDEVISNFNLLNFVLTELCEFRITAKIIVRKTTTRTAGWTARNLARTILQVTEAACKFHRANRIRAETIAAHRLSMNLLCV